LAEPIHNLEHYEAENAPTEYSSSQYFLWNLNLNFSITVQLPVPTGNSFPLLYWICLTYIKFFKSTPQCTPQSTEWWRC